MILDMGSSARFRFNRQFYFHPLDSQEKRAAYALFLKAYECQMQGEIDEAVAYYQESLEIYPTAEAHTFLGWAYSFMDMYEEAIEQCHQAIQTDPELGNPYNDIGTYLIEIGKTDEAIPWLQKAALARRYETYHFPHFNLGRIWEKKGNWFQAIEAYEDALQVKPDYDPASKALKRLKALLN